MGREYLSDPQRVAVAGPGRATLSEAADAARPS